MQDVQEGRQTFAQHFLNEQSFCSCPEKTCGYCVCLFLSQSHGGDDSVDQLTDAVCSANLLAPFQTPQYPNEKCITHLKIVDKVIKLGKKYLFAKSLSQLPFSKSISAWGGGWFVQRSNSVVQGQTVEPVADQTDSEHHIHIIHI